MAKVLLVEDDPLMVRMYQRKLASDGYGVEVAVNGEEGLLKIRSFRPDLVLLDIMMPKLNGLQVLERMKADPTVARIPVIILTNLGGSQEDVERGLELGAVAYLVKSAYRPDEVVAKVKEVLAGYTRSKEVPGAAGGMAAGRVAEQTTSVGAQSQPTPEPPQPISQPVVPQPQPASQPPQPAAPAAPAAPVAPVAPAVPQPAPQPPQPAAPAPQPASQPAPQPPQPTTPQPASQPQDPSRQGGVEENPPVAT